MTREDIEGDGDADVTKKDEPEVVDASLVRIPKELGEYLTACQHALDFWGSVGHLCREHGFAEFIAQHPNAPEDFDPDSLNGDLRNMLHLTAQLVVGMMKVGDADPESEGEPH